MGQFCTMDITEQCVVALTWTLKDTLGEVLDVLDDPVEFLVGGDDLLPRIQEALQGHGPGARLDLHIEPEEAFGDFNDQLLFLEPRKLFPAEVEEGMTIEGSALPKGTNPDAPRNALVHRHRDLPRAHRAGRQPPAGGHCDPPEPESRGGARSHGRRGRSRHLRHRLLQDRRGH
jgi:hypothetical protein